MFQRSDRSGKLIEDARDRLRGDRAACECIGQSGVEVARPIAVEQCEQQGGVA